MRRMVFGGVVSWAAVAVISATAPERRDAVGDLRQALGGEAALAKITSLRVTGKVVTPGRPGNGQVDVYLDAPDKFALETVLPPRAANDCLGRNGTVDTGCGTTPLATAQRPNDGAVTAGSGDSYPATQRLGVVGDVPFFDDPWGLGRSAGGDWRFIAQREYARIALPLLATTSAVYPVTATSEINQVTFLGGDGRVWKLALDPTTHRPREFRWPSGSIASGTPARALAVTVFSDYRKTGSVTWPYRWVTTIDGVKTEDISIKKYEINGRISPKVFRGK